jgi:hypothetical protein
MSWKEQILNKLFRDVNHYYECNNVLHFGYDSTGYPGKWTAHPFCGKRLRKWVGFSDIQYSKTEEICSECVMLFFAQKLLVASNGQKEMEKQP